MSDHYSPWLDEQGHAPYAWSVLGAVTQSTERVELMTYVTCPTMRYHPAVVAQKAATVQALSGGRFTLGLGAGENLNEHVVGRGWPPANVRHDMLAEALQIIGGLFDGGYVDYEGKHFRVDSAKLWDLPEQPGADRHRGVRCAVDPAVRAGRRRDDRRRAEGGAGRASGTRPKLGRADAARSGRCRCRWGTDRDAAVKRAHEQFRWFAGGWKVNAELPGPAGLRRRDAVRPPEDDVAGSIPCGPDVGRDRRGRARRSTKAGFTDVALVQIGGDQQDGFLDFAEKELLPALRG